MQEALKTLSQASEDLNEEADAGSAVIREIEEEITLAQPGVAVWLDRDIAHECGVTIEVDEDANMVETSCHKKSFWTIGWGRYAGTWRIFVREMTYTCEENGEEIDLHEVVGGDTPLLGCSKEMRDEAARLLLPLVEAITDAARERAVWLKELRLMQDRKAAELNAHRSE